MSEKWFQELSKFFPSEGSEAYERKKRYERANRTFEVAIDKLQLEYNEVVNQKKYAITCLKTRQSLTWAKFTEQLAKEKVEYEKEVERDLKIAVNSQSYKRFAAAIYRLHKHLDFIEIADRLGLPFMDIHEVIGDVTFSNLME